ncbi:MFS transporter [Humitalea sp. 24SJ18S-53]|uniref:MFS transporter n=1 Tax=Humitalea sp. 24SJ18S-53 TaxID=3422307 RepID=UPI003D66D7D2
MRPFTALFAANTGAHAADQLALAALPLTAALVFGAGPGMIGALVAAQGSAWLICSLPAGVLVDRASRRGLLLGAMAVAVAGLGVALAGALWGVLALLGLGAAIASAGTVLFALTVGALVPVLVPGTGMAAANARLEFFRALATLAAPLAVGLLAERGVVAAAYAIALLAALAAAAVAARLPVDAPAAAVAQRPHLAVLLREGAGFVAGQPLLRAIFLCAVFWNFAFFAWLAGFVPFALTVLRLEPAGIGLAQAGYGAGLLLGALAVAPILARVPPRVVLVAGPTLSLIAPLLLLAGPPGLLGAGLAQMSVGFGPMLWLVAQTSIRQALTPAALQGRVAATMQVAQFGVRPLGALAGGFLAAAYGPQAAIWLVAAGFGVSLAVAVVSPLSRLGAMPVRV